MLSGTTRLPDTRNFLNVKRELNRTLPRIKGCNGDYPLHPSMTVCSLAGSSPGRSHRQRSPRPLDHRSNGRIYREFLKYYVDQRITGPQSPLQLERPTYVWNFFSEGKQLCNHKAEDFALVFWVWKSKLLETFIGAGV